jgi:VCBS repeat-containing protein
VPDWNNGTTVSSQYYAWDQTSGSQYGTADVTDGHRGGQTAFSLDTATVTLAVTDVNDPPVIGGVLTGPVTESGDIADINEAGQSGGFEPAMILAPTITTELGTLLTAPATLLTVLSHVTTALGSASQAIAVIWDYLDDIYTSAGANQIHVNDAFTRLGAAYASQLKAGTIGSLIDVTAKYKLDDGDADTLPQRNQSLHDNLLGNLTNSALDQRYGSVVTGLRLDLSLLIQGVDASLLSRPYFEGNQGDSDVAERSWDIQHGYVPAASGQLTVSDSDTGDSHTWASHTTPGTYGTFTLDANGAWTYVLDDARPATQALSAGQTQTETFSVSVTDGAGAVGTQQVSITITGTNDAPVISTDNETIVTTIIGLNGEPAVQRFLAEANSALVSTGRLIINDVDTTGPITAKVLSVSAAAAATIRP